MQNGTTTRRHRIDRHHRRAHPHARDFGFKRTLKSAGVKRDIGGGAAHVKADDTLKPTHRCGARRADNPARGARQDRILALEMPGFGQPAARLHEVKPHTRQFARHLIHIAAQNGGKIRIHHGSIPTRHNTRQRACAMAERDLRKANFPRNRTKPFFMRRVRPGMHHQNGNGAQTFLISGAQSIPRPGLIQGFQFRAIHRDTPADFNGAFMQQFRQAHIQIKQPGPRLIADAQQISKTAIDQQQNALTLAFQ